MNNIKVTIGKTSNTNGGNGFKVIEVNVMDPAQSIYAVCTPVKKQ